MSEMEREPVYQQVLESLAPGVLVTFNASVSNVSRFASETPELRVERGWNGRDVSLCDGDRYFRVQYERDDLYVVRVEDDGDTRIYAPVLTIEVVGVDD